MADPAGAPTRPRPRSLARRILRGLAWTLGAILLITAIALAIAIHQLDGRVRAAMLAEAAKVEADTGRKIDIGDVHISLGRTAEIVVRDVSMGPAPGATGVLAEPPLRVSAMRLGVRLGPLVRSWGKSIDVTTLAVEGPELTIVRTPEGLSIDDVRARILALPPRPRRTRPDFVLERAALTGGKIRLRATGGARGADLDLDPIDLKGENIRVDAPSHLALTATITKDAKLELGVDLAPPPGATAGTPVTLSRAALRLTGLGLAPILAWLPENAARGIDLGAAVIGADLALDPTEAIALGGKLTLAGAKLARAEGNGPPVDGTLAIDARFDPVAGSLAARAIDLEAAGIKAHLRFDATSIRKAPAIEGLELDASGDAAALLALLPPDRIPRGAAIKGPLSISVRGGFEAGDAKARIKLDLGEIHAIAGDPGHEDRGDAARVAVEASIAYTAEGRRIALTDLAISAGDLSVRGDATTRGIGDAIELESLALSATAPLEKLLALAPPSRRPRGVVLRGPVAITAALHGAPASLAGKVTIDLDRAIVQAPGFTKPAGVRLGAEIEGKRAGGLAIDRAALRLASVTLGARGKVDAADRLDLAFELRDASIEPVLALLPQAKARLEGVVLEGRVTAKGTIARNGGKTRAEVHLGVRDLLARKGLVSLVGAPEATVRVEATAGAASVDVDVDLDGAQITAFPAFAKKAGRPARVAFGLTREGSSVKVSNGRLTLPGLSIEGLDVAADPQGFRVHAAATTVSLGPLAEIVPLLRDRFSPALAGAVVRFGLDLSGNPNDPAADALHLTAIDFTSGLGRARGSIDVDGLRRPRAVRFEVTGGDLDFSAAGGGDGGGALSPEDLDLPIAGRVHLDAVRVRGERAEGLDAEIALEKGRIAVKSLAAKLLGGSVALEPSWVELSGTPELDLHARVEGIDMSRLGAPAGNELRGRASGRVDLHGKGSSKDALVRSLRGAIRVALRGAHGRATFHPKISIVNPLLGPLMERAAKKKEGQPHAFDVDEATAALDLANGKLTTSEPMMLRSGDFAARLRGTIGLDRELALTGDLDLGPKAVHAMSEGKLLPLRHVPLRLKLDGKAGDMKLELLDLGDTVDALKGSIRNARNAKP